MDIFKGQNLLEFSDRFKTDLNCKEYLAGIKWKNGFKCVKCNHGAAQVRRDFSRTCNICGHTESATANTLFHKVKFGVREAMESSGNHPMDGTVHVDEFVIGGVEKGRTGRSYDAKKKKAVTAVQLTENGKVRHMYAMRIEDFSARSLQYIFINNISRSANVVTDKWKGYRPIAKAYDITQIESNNGLNFKALHTMIHQIKSWIRTTYSWVSDFNLDRYFNEFCFRLNPSQSKGTIFNNLITKMVNKEKVYQKELICA
jgi:hypothetical protein